MGINGWVFKATKRQYKGTFSTDTPECLMQRRHCAVKEAQQWIKCKPDDVRTVFQYKRYITDKVKLYMRNARCRNPLLIVCFDTWSPEQKAIMTHVKRDGDTSDRYEYDETRAVIDESDEHGEQEAFTQWSRYVKNRELVRRELYPIIYNAFLEERFFNPRPVETANGGTVDEQLVLHGLPGAWRYKRQHNVSFMDDPSVVYDEGTPILVPRERITPDDERRDPQLYGRVFVMRYLNAHACVHRFEWKEAAHDIGEADMATVHYWRFFDNCHYVIHMDDGDALPIALMHSFDRFRNGTFNGLQLYICKSRKGRSGKETRRIARHKKPRAKWNAADEADERVIQKKVDAYGGTKTWAEIESERPKYIYIDVNEMFLRIMGDPRLRSVQNPVLFYVCAIILTGTDFFGPHGGASFIPGVGIERVVWPTLFNEAADWSHMFQSSLHLEPDATRWRDVVIDKDAFVDFVHQCIIRANAPCTSVVEVKATQRKRERARVERITKNMTRSKSDVERAKEQAKIEKVTPKNTFPDDDTIRVHAAHMQHNILVFTNAHKPGCERKPNLYETDDDGVPYYGYVQATRSVAERVSRQHPWPVDEVYKRFLRKHDDKKNKRLKVSHESDIH